MHAFSLRNERTLIPLQLCNTSFYTCWIIGF